MKADLLAGANAVLASRSAGLIVATTIISKRDGRSAAEPSSYRRQLLSHRRCLEDEVGYAEVINGEHVMKSHEVTLIR